jgi:glycosyltransferase involved in cell wall biosynthesis
MPVAEQRAPRPSTPVVAPRPSHAPLRWLVIADGASVHTRRFITALAGTGIDMHLAAYHCKPPADAVFHDLGTRPHRDPRRVGQLVRRLRGVVDQVAPDVVNPHHVSGYGLLAAVAGHPHVVQTALGSDLLLEARGIRGVAVSAALRRARLGVGDSDGLLTAMRERAPRLSLARFVFGPPSWVFEAPRDPQRVIVSPRAHEPLYRIDAVLDAWRIACPRLPEHRLVVAGTGSLTGWLQGAAGARVRFTGQLDHSALLGLFLTADLTVSVPRSDSSSASVLEALAARSRVVASQLHANREWLPPRCLVAADASAEELAEAMVQGVVGDLVQLDRGWAIEAQAAKLVQRVEAMVR